MNNMTRREALAVAVGGASLLAQPQPQMAPSTGLLKKRIKGRTINVHTHLSGPPGPATPRAQSAFLPANRTTVKDLPPLTDEERNQAWTYLSRYKYDVVGFESPAQEEFYLRRYNYSKKHPAPTGTFEDNALRFLAEMDEAGIDTAVLLVLEFVGPIMRAGEPTDLSTERTEKVMAACAETCKNHPGRFVPFIGIDIRRGKDGAKLLETAITKYGFRGAGEIVGHMWHTMPDDKDKAYPYYEVCQQYKLPVMIDATMDGGFSAPAIYENIVRDFPNLTIAAGGAGIRVVPIEIDGVLMSATDRMLQLANKHENIWLDLDDWQVVDHAGIDRYLGYLRRALDGPARNKIMFGSDYPVFTWMYTEKEWIDTILKNADRGKYKFTPQEMDLFFSRNAERYLGLA